LRSVVRGILHQPAGGGGNPALGRHGEMNMRQRWKNIELSAPRASLDTIK
jgi:hypothetical protein